MLGIGIAPIVIILQGEILYTSYLSLIGYLLAIILICGVVGCLVVPPIKFLGIYLFIERPLMQQIIQSEGDPQVFKEAEFVLQQAYAAHYMSKRQYEALHHKLQQKSSLYSQSSFSQMKREAPTFN